MAKTVQMPAATTQPVTLLEAEFLGVERESKNYVVLGTVPMEDGKSAILIGNDGKVYLHKNLAAKVGGIPAGAKTGLEVTIQK